ncbi:Mu transposase C-terminal domain-containing protein [Pseudoduganella sp. RAF19]|uniref:Mu transposase C-terminal domain-containing protein n=1 Tax=Pseudoduganella sp. RAF19 TaxID=3233052 RepID=UPI003F98519E
MPVASSGALKDWQKRTAEARAALLAEVDRVAQLVGREKAIMKLVIMAQEGSLPDHLANLVPVANAKAGSSGKRTLSRRTIHRWIADTNQAKTADGRRQVNALAPKDAHSKVDVPEWAADLLAVYQTPQKPSLAFAVEQIAPAFGIDPTQLYHRARRFLGKMGNVELQRGRMGSRDLSNIKPFIRRDSSVLWPSDVYTADGHTFDAEVAHPAHGRPFRPEMTGVVDVATRKYVGWSVDLAESGLAVLDALRRACEVGGIPALFYVDNGSGYHNALMAAPGVGMESRLGFQKTHSIAYNSKARGIMERSHQTVWVSAAKELPTYIGATMDRQAMQKVHKLTRKEVAHTGRSKYLMPFNDFLKFANDHVDAYNNRPHRALPKVFDPELGRKRHMTPNEAWDQGVKDGAQLVTITEDESRDLFRPQREVKTLRGEVRLFGNLYFAHALQEYHGDVVRVGYDVHNADQVWVYDHKDRFICNAGFEANKRAYFAESAMEVAARKRAAARLQRLDVKRQEVHDELHGAPLVLENAPSPTLQDITGVSSLQMLDVELLAVPVEAPTRPIFMLESDRYEWLMQHQGEWNANDRQFLEQFVASDIYESLQERFECLGLGWQPGATNAVRAG